MLLLKSEHVNDQLIRQNELNQNFKNELGLNMYDNTPDNDCKLGRLAEICQLRVSIYDRI